VQASAGIPKSSIELALLELSERLLEPHGFAVVDLDFHLMGTSVLRIFVERKQRDGTLATGTNLDDCAYASRLLDEALEASPLIPGRFDLEVSSPGLERRLRTLEDFKSQVGNTLQLKFQRKLEELGLGAKTTAELMEVDEASLLLKASGKQYRVQWEHLKQANRVWSF
jgi:ribosome maturation factor RimP